MWCQWPLMLSKLSTIIKTTAFPKMLKSCVEKKLDSYSNWYVYIRDTTRISRSYFLTRLYNTYCRIHAWLSKASPLGSQWSTIHWWIISLNNMCILTNLFHLYWQFCSIYLRSYCSIMLFLHEIHVTLKILWKNQCAWCISLLKQ